MVEEPSPTKCTQPVRRTYREIALQESTSTGSLLPPRVFTAFCVAHFPKATYNEPKLSGYCLRWTTSLCSQGMPESEVLQLIRYCQACNTFIRVDEVKAHIACNCPSNVAIGDDGSFKELWERLRIAGFNAGRLGLLFQGCSLCRRYVAHEYQEAHILHCQPAQEPSKVIEIALPNHVDTPSQLISSPESAQQHPVSAAPKLGLTSASRLETPKQQSRGSNGWALDPLLEWCPRCVDSLFFSKSPLTLILQTEDLVWFLGPHEPTKALSWPAETNKDEKRLRASHSESVSPRPPPQAGSEPLRHPVENLPIII
ncbi:hypothetical protein BT96DRAFT_994779 [Gymnopus androsaceus JB14]|uniref:Uncharacterized protein n=1 Tax=Gymnopus androsaceus JB14 TaxID=1447944 RepID=A0A6A4HLI4_9AGAR|nr:hypothetical protein BT96DRAFT_994779 [Gymnopus androsaceus JB14]